MIHSDRISIHNAAELVPDDRPAALRIQRVPESLRPHLNAGAQQKVLDPAGVEIRFVLEGPSAELTLSTAGEPLEALVFYGDIDGQQRFLIEEAPTTIRVEVPENHATRMATMPESAATTLPFSPAVVRLRFMYRGPLYLHGVEGDLRPPRADETPDRTILTYGTSITHGASSSRPYLSWPAQLAWRLGTDLVNLGVGGSCHAEREFSDYIGARNDWDLAVLGLSVNMVGGGFSVEEFSERVTYLLKTVAERQAGKPVFAVSLFPYFGDWDPSLQQNATAPPAEFREALARAVESVSSPNVRLIDGRSLLSAPAGLTADMVHPSDLGMIEIGEKLALQIGEHLS